MSMLYLRWLTCLIKVYVENGKDHCVGPSLCCLFACVYLFFVLLLLTFLFKKLSIFLFRLVETYLEPYGKAMPWRSLKCVIED